MYVGESLLDDLDRHARKLVLEKRREPCETLAWEPSP
jgi:hypothetical protein